MEVLIINERLLTFAFRLMYVYQYMYMKGFLKGSIMMLLNSIQQDDSFILELLGRQYD